LDSLSSAGLLKSQGARVVLEHPFATYGTWVGMFALPATFFSCIGYLIYAFFHARKST
jgi:succinate dehydrogenase hydrophobic anchor subunit